MIHILVVEDDKDLNQSVCRYLNNYQYQVTGCLNVTEAYDCLYAGQYDMIISDIMMPGTDGFEFAQMVRQQNQYIPILFMTAKDDLSSKQRGYRLGIDDYMVKPIDLEELILHIQALLRRANIAAQKKLIIGNLILDEEAVSAEISGVPIELTLREFQILFKLLSYPKRTFTRSQLLDEFNGLESESGLRTVDVHITNLRSKLADCDSFQIVTVRGLGYKAVTL
ncbi:response regulator transcription factor [Konateibacter massiliensis]|uniref:response regulator transcription factor n=1 Tax=Konateibacter massiliensis TaxID=2002841 RepID=UPI000C154052|nr:response regulator transcription factor [Konateibacter massiliensis]